jgi:hypothetical protein
MLLKASTEILRISEHKTQQEERDCINKNYNLLYVLLIRTFYVLIYEYETQIILNGAKPLDTLYIWYCL